MLNSIKFILIISLITIIFGCATFNQKDVNPPEVTFIQNNAYISPNGDNIQDSLVLDIGIKETNYISYWKLEVFDENGKSVKFFESDEKLLDQQKKLVLPNKSISVPKRIEWNGKDNNGSVVPDGEYKFVFIAMDNKKNISKKDSNTGIVYVDTDKPEVKTEVLDKIFSPNNDKNKDELKIKVNIIKSNVKDLFKKKDSDARDGEKQIWYVDILDEKDQLIKRYTYDKKGEQEIDWDGKDEKGDLVPDGKYKIKIYSTDLAGNYYEEFVSNIVKDTIDTPIKASVIGEAFSPNNDNIKDKIGFKFEIPILESIENWKFGILDSKGNIIKEFSGEKKPPLEIDWDGKDKNGKTAQEGEYVGQLEIVYNNGNTPTNNTASFILDITSPNANVSLSSGIFSPDGNKKQDELFVDHKLSKEETKWEGVFYNSKGESVKNYEWQGQSSYRLVWEGKNNSNTLLEDGEYYYQLKSTDKAGNSYNSEKFKVKIYTGDIPLFMTASLKSFSPNGDDIKDVQNFEIRSTIPKENKVSEWELEIKDSKNNTVYTTGSKGSLPEKIDWNGKINTKTTAPDGTYTAFLKVTFAAGTESKSESKEFLIDTTPPEFSVTNNLKYFSPDDDGINDELTFNLSAKDETGINKWSIRILSPYGGTVFREFNGIGDPTNKIIWDGISSDGELVESVEDYPVILYAEDLVGNSIEKRTDPIMIDILVIKLKDGRLKVRVSNIKFKPNKAIMTSDEKNVEVLKLLSNALKKYPQHNIIMEGFANRYAEKLNEKIAKELSEDRAKTVSKELNKRGIKKERMTIVGRGFDDPIIPLKKNMTIEEKAEMARNRRVEFYLEKK